ncbi:MAG: class II aldolase/adducin family protein [Candidatus Kapaibacterium sp.]
MIDEGYIKFQCDWTESVPPDHPGLPALIAWRNRLHRLGLIGVYPDGIGYGNVSARDGGRGCVISGSGTGGIVALDGDGYTRVISADIAGNRVACVGPVMASSETMSHMAVYLSAPDAGAVIHVHSLAAWNALLGNIPTTDAAAAYGTPEMAREIGRLVNAGKDRSGGMIAMAGHREGLIAYGRDPGAAGEILLAYIGRL